MNCDDQPSTSTSIPKMSQYDVDDLLISEVKKRRILWDRKHRQIGDKSKEWQAIASILNRNTAEIKARFRNLRDTFHREEKKVKLPPVDEGKSLMSYYRGYWTHFEQLLFLYGNRNSTEHVGENVTEIDLSEYSNDSDERDTIASPNVLNRCTDENASDFYEPGKKSGSNNKSGQINKRKRTTEPLPKLTELDEDVLFVKSLVPFFRKLNPIRRIILRNEMQNLLIKELICDRCQLIGPQSNCHCKLSLS